MDIEVFKEEYNKLTIKQKSNCMIADFIEKMEENEKRTIVWSASMFCFVLKNKNAIGLLVYNHSISFMFILFYPKIHMKIFFIMLVCFLFLAHQSETSSP